MEKEARLYAWATFRPAGVYWEDFKMRFLMVCSFSMLPSLPKTSTLRQILVLALCRYASSGPAIRPGEQHLHPVFLSMPNRDTCQSWATANASASGYAHAHRLLDWNCRSGPIFNRGTTIHQPGLSPHSSPEGKRYDDSRSASGYRLWRAFSGWAQRLAHDRWCLVDLQQWYRA